MENKLISLCMIVKNESDNLSKCLSAVNEFAAQIIVIDTGSTDNTKEIAQKFTKDVYDFEWCNDFAKARNFSIDKADNDWILVIDADETITGFDINSINNFTNENENNVGRIKRVNPFEDVLGIKRYTERVNRFFNRKFFKYDGIIHEQLVRKDGKPYNTCNIDITANHIGYTNDVVNLTGKLERNITLLKQALINDSCDPYLLYQLGKSYYMKKDYKSAFDYFKAAVDNKPCCNLEYVEDLVESYGYSMINCEMYNSALELLDYKKYYNTSSDFNFLCGLILMNNERFSDAIQSFLKCIGENEGRIEGINSYLPNYNIGVILYCLGQNDNAQKYFTKCGNYAPALKMLER